jgi:hypothetical protein
MHFPCTLVGIERTVGTLEELFCGLAPLASDAVWD